jgi:4-azaleucine resistance transporter AzlC
MTIRQELLAGIRAELPITLGVIPFGMIYGVLAVGAGLSPLAAQAMSCIVFAGSAQFIAAGLFSISAPAGVLLLTTFVVNLRHSLYSASMAPYLERHSLAWKVLLSYLLTDEAYVVAILHYKQTGAVGMQHWYFLGAGLTLWLTWQASTVVGVLLRAQVPASWALDFTLALTFIGLVVVSARDRPSIAAALAAGVTAILAAGWPYQLGLVAAAVVGIAAGLALESRRPTAEAAAGFSTEESTDE